MIVNKIIFVGHLGCYKVGCKSEQDSKDIYPRFIHYAVVDDTLTCLQLSLYHCMLARSLWLVTIDDTAALDLPVNLHVKTSQLIPTMITVIRTYQKVIGFLGDSYISKPSPFHGRKNKVVDLKTTQVLFLTKLVVVWFLWFLFLQFRSCFFGKFVVFQRAGATLRSSKVTWKMSCFLLHVSREPRNMKERGNMH